MATILTTFKDLLTNQEFGIRSVTIPRIQRSYAQGRNDRHAARTRERFLSALHEAVKDGRYMTLDFIYGNINNGILVPLDGQQRLTTLFLLHWYAALKGKHDADFLSKFNYATRYSARDFCRKLVEYRPQSGIPVSESVSNEGWFPLDWKNDPTVNSMLTMLDAIDGKFRDIENLWEKLDNIRFYFLNVEELKLTDDIYIKMNSRGKPLTQFEHFKAEWLKLIDSVDPALKKEVAAKLDIRWTDMLWPYRGENDIIDDEFLRYFHLLCDLMCYRDNHSAINADDFDLLKTYFTVKTPDDNDTEENAPDAVAAVKSNIEFVKARLDCWADIPEGIDSFFSRYISHEHEEGKICIPADYMINLFEDCLRNNEMKDKKRGFMLPKLALLNAFIIFLLNRTPELEKEFPRRLRIVWNLIRNSRNEVVDNPGSFSGNRMPAVLKQIESIILNGEILQDITIDGLNNRPNFARVQISEEIEKLAYTVQHPEMAEALFRLEDHNLLTGRIEVVGLRHTEYFARFEQLFRCDYDAIDCAMLSLSDYSQRENDTISLGTGNTALESVWSQLFHRGETSKSFGHTQTAMTQLLEAVKDPTDDELRKIASAYIEKCRKEGKYDWRYYYITYPSFRWRRYGKYTMPASSPYQMVAWWTPKKESSNARQTYLNELDLYPEYCDNIRYVPYMDGYLFCDNNAFRLYDSIPDPQSDNAPAPKEIKRLSIPANEDGTDAVDRIEWFRLHDMEDVAAPEA